MKLKNILTSAIFIVFLIFALGCAPQQQKPETQSIEKTSTSEIKQTGEDFGCFYSCTYFPEGYPKQICEDWKAGKEVQWPPDCKLMQYGPCIKLCESEKKNNPISTTPDDSNYKGSGEGTDHDYQQQKERDCGISGISKDENPDNAYIYISDFGKHRLIRMDDMGGTGWVSFGSFGNSINQFNNPRWGDIGPDGKIYIPDMRNDRIVRIDDITGKGWVTYGVSGSTAAGRYALAPASVGKFVEVLAVGLDSKGRIYIVNGAYNRVVRIDDMTGAGWTTFGSQGNDGAGGSGVNQFNGLKGLAIDAQDHIYVTDKNNYRVVRFDDMTGKGWTTFGSKGAGVGQFADDIGQISFDKEGRIYIADEHNNRIVRIDDMTGKGWTEFHGVGNDTLALPQAVAVTSAGRIYIVESRNNRASRIDDMTGKGWKVYGLCRELGQEDDPLRENPYQMSSPKGILVIEK